MPDSDLLTMLEDGTRRLIHAVDQLDDLQWGEPSRLPGWSRSHVVAHLILNAEALVASLAGVRDGALVPMYPTQERRAADIDELAGQPSEDLRERFLATTTLIAEAVATLPDGLADTPVERVLRGSTFPAGAALAMRVREVEIHHVDLDLDYAVTDWSPAFAANLLDGRSATYSGEPFTAYAADLERRWSFGAEAETGAGPTVTGPASALAWWASGRDLGPTTATQTSTLAVLSDDGQVPRIEAW